MLKVQVIGTLWEGNKSAYDYNTNTAPQTVQEAERLAGDFQSLDDFQVIEITSGGDWSHSWIKRKVIRPWALPESEDSFCPY